jgi:hypothetical protein
MILERGDRRVCVPRLDRVDDPLVLADDLLEDLGPPLGAQGVTRTKPPSGPRNARLRHPGGLALMPSE